MAKKKNVREHHKLHQSATRVVAHGERVREQVRELTERTLRGERTPLHSIGDVVSTMMSGAMEAMDEAVPAQAGNVLREVIGGLTEGASAIVDSSQRTIHTAEQGRRKILDAATNAMKAMPGSAAHAALEAASDFASTVGAAMRSQIEHLVEEARRSGGVVRPAATRVLRAAGSHPAELARETGGAGVRLAVGAASRMMSAGGGVLTGLAEGLSESKLAGGSRRSDSEPAKRRTGEKARAAATRPAAQSKVQSKDKSGAKSGGKTAVKAGAKSEPSRARSVKSTTKKTTKSAKPSGARPGAKKSVKSAAAKASARSGGRTTRARASK